jgi:hypothetical protein
VAIEAGWSDEGQWTMEMRAACRPVAAPFSIPIFHRAARRSPAR